MAYPFGAMVQLLMLTGQRRVEVAGMEWGELNRDEGIWTIPASRTKNKKTHIVHLTPQALAVINRLPVLSDTYVLTTTGTAAISGFSKAKLRLDEELLAARRKHDPEAKGLEDWQYHDLRRTLATGLASMGVAQAIIEKILNHNPKALHGVAGIYNRHEYLPDRKAALEPGGDGWRASLGREARITSSSCVWFEMGRHHCPCASFGGHFPSSMSALTS